MSTSSRAALIPPSRRGIVLLTSGRFRRRLQTHNLRDVPRGRPHITVTLSLLATARIWWRSTAGHEQIAATVCRDSQSIGRGSISDSRLVLAMHKSGTAGRDITCCGVEAPRRPASRCLMKRHRTLRLPLASVLVAIWVAPKSPATHQTISGAGRQRP